MIAGFIGISGERTDLTELVEEVVRKTGFRSVEIAGWGVLLHDQDTELTRFDRGGGALLGVLLDQSGTRTVIDNHMADAIEASRGKLLIDAYWGSYLLFARHGAARIVLRDPGGGVPCYYFTWRGAMIVTSCPAKCVAAGLLPHDLDWSAVAMLLRFTDAPGSLTAVRGLRELLPGFALSIEGVSTSCAPQWHPWQFARRDDVWRDEQCAAEVRRQVIACVKALADIHEPPLVRVSGGLDSSIVAVALSASGAHPSMINMVAAGLGDEREYVRDLAARVGREATEYHYRLDQIDIHRPTAPGLARPWGRYLGQAASAACADVADGRRISIWQGHGGDGVFCTLGSTSPVVDRVRRRGPGFYLLPAIREVARSNGATLLEAAADLVTRLAKPVAPYRWYPNNEFLAAEHLGIEAPEQHPWLIPQPGALAGKLSHLAQILGSLRHVEGYQRQFRAPVVNPLLAQPVIELALSIPAWEWCAGARDRVPARQGFGDLLPESIARRRTKGTPDPFCAQIVSARRDDIRELLLTGLLVRHGVVDGPAVDRALSNASSVPGNGFRRLLQLADAEAWAQSWAAL